MKSVWVIEEGEYSDYRVVGIFTSKANAELVYAKMSNGDSPQVNEWVLDPGVDEIQKGWSQWRVLMQSDGTVESAGPVEFSSYNISMEAHMC